MSAYYSVVNREDQPVVDEQERIENRESTTKRIVRGVGRLTTRAAVFGALGITGGIALSTIVPTEVPLGPGSGRATVTLDGKATVDAGLIGSARKNVDGPSFGPIDLGIKVRANEISALSRPEDAAPLTELTVDSVFEDINDTNISQYGELYRTASTESDDVTEALRTNTLKLSFLVGSVCLALYSIPGKKGRREIYNSVTSRKSLLLLVPLVTGATFASVPAYSHQDWNRVSTEYDGTPLEGVEISGAAAMELVNNYGQRIMRYIRETDEFYDSAKETAETEMESRVLLGQRPEDAENTVFLFFTDNHGNTGTPKIMANVADIAGAKFAVDTGDTVPSGTGYEEHFIRQQMRAFNNRDIELIQVPGNHDSPITSGFLRKRGAKILSGTAVNVSGVTFLGDADPRSSQFGQGLQQRGGKTISELGTELADKSCETKEPTILLVHDKRAADEALMRGCVDLSLSGHTHKPEIVSTLRPDDTLTNRITGGSSGGAQEYTLTYGPLQQDSTFMLVSVKDGQLKGRQYFTITADGEFIISPIIDTLSS
ncbi:metallophosphoesterase family protein [Candidatus Saccharibacteria bacterium]|nr:metallophosphoesterase family protein [Candidatus Saccharibacteria bacterium]